MASGTANDFASALTGLSELIWAPAGIDLGGGTNTEPLPLPSKRCTRPMGQSSTRMEPSDTTATSMGFFSRLPSPSGTLSGLSMSCRGP